MGNAHEEARAHTQGWLLCSLLDAVGRHGLRGMLIRRLHTCMVGCGVSFSLAGMAYSAYSAYSVPPRS